MEGGKTWRDSTSHGDNNESFKQTSEDAEIATGEVKCSSDVPANNSQVDDYPAKEDSEHKSEDESDAASESLGGEEETIRMRKHVERNPKRIEGFSKYLNLLEQRLGVLEKKVLPAPPSEERASDQPKHEASIPELRLVKWRDFKHKYADDKTTFAIEVLIGPAQFWTDRAKGQRLHFNFNLKQPLHVPEQSSPVTEEDIAAQDDMPQRIRINSLPILAILNRMAEESIDNTPRVLLRPYHRLLYFESQIRKSLEELKTRWTLSATLEAAQANTTPLAVSVETENTQGNQAQDVLSEKDQTLINSAEAMDDLQCLVDFLDKFVKPYLGRFDNITKGKIRFQDLWQLFKPGDTVYMPIQAPKPKADQDLADDDTLFGKRDHGLSKGTSRTQVAYKVITVMGGRAELRPRENAEGLTSEKLLYTELRVALFYVEFDGKEFLPFATMTYIPSFDGEREISSLLFYPWRFVENGTKMLESLVQRGRNFLEYTTSQHRFYNGATLARTPNGHNLTDSFGNPEHVESDVIVDFHQTFQSHSEWRPTTYAHDLDQDDDEYHEQYDTIVWANHEHNKIQTSSNDVIDKDWLVVRRRMEDYTNSVPIFKTKPLEEGESYDGTRLDDDLLMLLPERVFGYNLLDRQFCQLSIENLRHVPDKQDGYDSLKLPGDKKGMVRALVSAHFMKMKVINASFAETVDYDIVRGKGRGLILLLHGMPGVGKTSTAETVAQSLHKPLLPIVCGDLGTTAETVEKSLSEMFRLAQHWDCVLLLDEADVFLAQRTERDLQQNALVSVFLRKLEWFSGILFLTTNRVGVIDEAFKSRIHMTLYYPPLSMDQTMDIWKMNLDRVKRIDQERIKGTDQPPMRIDEEQILDYARTHFEQGQGSYGGWNGRQIRNAFQTATALALYRAQEENEKRPASDSKTGPVAPRLRRKDFKTVATATFQFDEYMKEVAGADASRAAYMHKVRADHMHTTSSPGPSALRYDGSTPRKNVGQQLHHHFSPTAGPSRPPYSYTYEDSTQRTEPGTGFRGPEGGGYQTGPPPFPHTRETSQGWEGSTHNYSQTQQELSPFPYRTTGHPQIVRQSAATQDSDTDDDSGTKP